MDLDSQGISGPRDQDLSLQSSSSRCSKWTGGYGRWTWRGCSQGPSGPEDTDLEAKDHLTWIWTWPRTICLVDLDSGAERKWTGGYWTWKPRTIWTKWTWSGPEAKDHLTCGPGGYGPGSKDHLDLEDGPGSQGPSGPGGWTWKLGPSPVDLDLQQQQPLQQVDLWIRQQGPSGPSGLRICLEAKDHLQWTWGPELAGAAQRRKWTWRIWTWPGPSGPMDLEDMVPKPRMFGTLSKS
ncbi:hypothetical protein AVEN_17408-1 [Araneus ventricosus]|uniref:Uncharacterized protein n=1 Tax=Araneus ventricosus TaxID=182803 RepID=A0A4Y2GZ77_ARAVE|nr:hypothetical protein AVEN_17408-1 [Araneus ventricosus]